MASCGDVELLGTSDEQGDDFRPVEVAAQQPRRDGVRVIGPSGRQYEIGRRIGQGAQGKVYAATDSQRNEAIAMKIIRVDGIEGSAQRMEHLRQEVMIAMKLPHHPHIVSMGTPLIDVPFPRKNYPTETYNVVAIPMEFLQYGEILQFMQYSGPFDEPFARYFFRQLVEAVIVCHKEGVAHRDIKPNNILVGNDLSTVLLADFGFASFGMSALQTRCGTRLFMAPEIPDGNYSGEKADIWSLGCTLFFLVTGNTPCPFDQSEQIRNERFEELKNEEYELFWEWHSQYTTVTTYFQDLIENMLKVDPAKRYSMKEIAECEWLTTYGDPTPEYVREHMTRRLETIVQVKERARSKAKQMAHPETVHRGLLAASSNDKELTDQLDAVNIKDKTGNAPLKSSLLCKPNLTGDVETTVLEWFRSMHTEPKKTVKGNQVKFKEIIRDVEFIVKVHKDTSSLAVERGAGEAVVFYDLYAKFEKFLDERNKKEYSIKV
eukprot:gb/GECG01013795.1/.p1 GENE.gb/GECG01013795.1/~~gb/GECG01013795.1/.p1  ORF type:complete len:490 (+),score=62.73 gb/GECG01013795.1/:1-1470(+)